MKSSTFTFKDSEGAEIFCYRWAPDSKPVAAVQISHGMAEHAARYAEFAERLTQAGFVVYANDHRGHGKTAGSLEKAGHFADKNGWKLTVQNLKDLNDLIRKEQGDIPCFMLGHSMGSFLARNYMHLHGDTLKGVILSGSGGTPGVVLAGGRMAAKMAMVTGKRKKPSPTLDKMSFGSFNSKFAPNRTAFDWLSRDNEHVDRYINDPFCGFICTGTFFHEVLGGIKAIQKKSNIARIPKTLPIFIVAGANDPVGNNTRALSQLIDTYTKAGIKNVEHKFYTDARHEILNEINREEVYADIVNWLKKQM